jgi:uncharacterized protein (TIGR01777 family)
MKIAVTGATGFVGSAVTDEALRRGHEVVILTRRPEVVPPRPGTQVQLWGEGVPPALPAVDAVVHLASENVGGDWSEEKKRRILESRRDGTRRLVDAIRGNPPELRPRVLVSASGIGYYGDAERNEELREDAPAGTGFMAEVCLAWEGETRRAEEMGLRVGSLRLGVVLGPGGGLLARVLPRFRAGQGAPLGDGRHWFPWIHRDDVVGLFLFAAEQDRLRGPVNAVSPGITRALEFARALAGVLGQPLASGPPAGRPGVPGGPPPTQAANHHVVPAAAAAAGYVYRFPELTPALENILGPRAERAP